MVNLQVSINAIIILILGCILMSAFGVQIFLKEEPCPLCLIQRLGMIGVATSLLMNIWFGIRMSHYGLGIVCSLIGGAVALRQIALHVCPGYPAFGMPIFGLNLYTWSFLIFASCILAISLLLFLYEPKEQKLAIAQPNTLGWAAFSLLLFVTATNIVTTFLQCGLGPCQD